MTRGGTRSWYSLPTTVGMVNHDPTRYRAPGYSIGMRFNEHVRPTPGPKYKVDGSLTSKGTGRSPSYSISGRPKRSVWDSMITSSPGPSNYSLPASNTSWEKRAPMYSFGFPFRTSKRTSGPAPNSYQLPTTLGSHVPHMKGSPSSTIHSKGSDIKGFAFDNAKTPGPAGYGPVDLCYTTRRAPAVTLKGRTKLPGIKLVTPGPGAYDPGNGSNVSKASPRFSMRVRHGDNVLPLFTLADISN